MSIVIRNVVARDALKIASMQLRSELYVEYADIDDETKYSIVLPLHVLERLWVNRLSSFNEFCDENYYAFVAFDEDNDYLCGVIGLSIYENIGYIRTLYVDPDYLHQGIGTALLNKGLNWLVSEKGCDIIRLEVLQINDKAISLYRKFGFINKMYDFPEALGGTAQNLFPNGEYIVKKMQVKANNIKWFMKDIVE